jgi:hypothetical protein
MPITARPSLTSWRAENVLAMVVGCRVTGLVGFCGAQDERGKTVLHRELAIGHPHDVETQLLRFLDNFDGVGDGLAMTDTE